MHKTMSIPLVRLNLIVPFINELDRRGVNTNAVLATSSLVRETVLDVSVFVPPIVIHRFLEDAAYAAQDPYFAVRVGEKLDWAAWPPTIEAAAKANDLVGFLVRFFRAASAEASSARHELDINAKFAVFREKRTSEQEIAPAQNDAFTAAYTLSLLHQAAGAIWDAEQVRLTVCDTAALPTRYKGVHIIGGDREGVTVRFPSAWLLEPFNRASFLKKNSSGTVTNDLPKQFIDALQHVIAPHLNEAELSLGSVSTWVGVSPQSLQRKLRAADTTLTAVIRNMKNERAIESLLHTNGAIGDIAASLGFNNPTSFTRAFKGWTGLSPREYRKANKGH